MQQPASAAVGFPLQNERQQALPLLEGEEAQLLPLPEEVKIALNQPCTYISIGPSQVGKSFFLRTVLGRHDIKVGDGAKSTTFQPTKHAAVALGGTKVGSFFIDTVGLLDTRGDEVDKKNEVTLLQFLEENVDRKMPVAVLLFFRKLDAWTGPALRTVELVAKVAKLYGAEVLAIYTYANSTDFPSQWADKVLKKNKRDGQNMMSIEDENTFLSQLWKEGKDKMVREALEGLNPGIIEVDLGRTALRRGEGKKYVLYDGSNCLSIVAEALSQVSKSALLLMLNSKDKTVQKAATNKLQSWLRDTLNLSKDRTIACALANGGMLGVYCAAYAAAQGATLAGALGTGVTGVIVGTAGTAAVLFVPLLVVTGLGVALYLQ